MSLPANSADSLLRCPNDNSRMEKERIGPVTVDRCNSCGRLWLDDGEMQALLQHESTVEEADAGPFGRESGRSALGGRLCPRDGRELLEIRHPQRPDVLIEFCPGCKGVLLDAGELRQIKGASAGEAKGWLKKMQAIVRW